MDGHAMAIGVLGTLLDRDHGVIGFILPVAPDDVLVDVDISFLFLHVMVS